MNEPPPPPPATTSSASLCVSYSFNKPVPYFAVATCVAPPPPPPISVSGLSQFLSAPLFPPPLYPPAVAAHSFFLALPPFPPLAKYNVVVSVTVTVISYPDVFTGVLAAIVKFLPLKLK